MRIDTKFEVDQQVCKIRNRREEKWIPCAFCKGTGGVVGADGTRGNCPKCYGAKGCAEFLPTKWQIDEVLTVGEVRVEVRGEHKSIEDSRCSNYGSQSAKRVEAYMCRETGIGTGTLHSVEDLFATEEEAQAECDRRNAEGGDDEGR